MSLIKLLKSSKLFKKDVITFLIIKRYDLGVIDDKLHYIAVKPSASVSQLRHKVWHLLDLPDYCEEIIILKTEKDHEIPLTELRKGNNPQHPYVMEVWLPGKKSCSTSIHNNMLTMGDKKTLNGVPQENLKSNNCIFEEAANQEMNEKSFGTEISRTTILYNTKALNKLRVMEQDSNQKLPGTEYKKSELSCKMSSSSIFFKLHGRKSRDNFVNILLKIQNDLTTLGNKLSDLENRIHV
ncbi:uncharacterized protein LOC123870402 [Maniola jurtina]|uniref:uncharacterized protein LOC123870402 n=1 Tax=Maniola jurtina TaxID=191418 RepID=UPI001E68B074|nr:uncharacterized protein LOC123870402 [Maniola jurtina]